MNHFNTFDELPPHVQRDLAPIVDGMRANIDFVRRWFAQCIGGEAFPVESCSGRSVPHQVYEDDGNTPAAGTEYRFAWFHSLEAGNVPRYHDFYDDSYRRCVVHAVDITYRNSDKTLRRAYSSVSVGLYGDHKPARIWCNLHSGALRLTTPALCDLIEQVKRVHDRIEREKMVQHIVDSR